MSTDGASAEHAATFEQHRPRLIGLAYRMCGSISDAEDIVQEAWLRWDRSDRSSIESPAAWLTTATSRLAIDRLRARSRRRESYPGPFLPEPAGTTYDPELDPSAPEPAAERRESLEFGFLVVLDRLQPVDRVVFVLADVFAVPFAEIAHIVERSPDACRRIASRARRRVRDDRRGCTPVDEGLLGELVGAVALGEVDRVISLLAPDVVLTSDGGPDRRAARRPVLHPDRVARLMVNLAGRAPADATIGIEQLNASAALVVRAGDDSFVLLADREPERGLIERIHLQLNPAKLSTLWGSTVLD